MYVMPWCSALSAMERAGDADLSATEREASTGPARALPRMDRAIVMTVRVGNCIFVGLVVGLEVVTRFWRFGGLS